jgi:cardiolipin synthase
MDMRSFEHNFEILSVIYDKGCAGVIEKQFLDDAAACRELTPAMWARRSRRQKVLESVSRLLSPLL